MKIYFIRNTHDENGNYRGDEYFGKIDYIKQFKQRLESKNPATEKEINEWQQHNKNIEEQELFFGVHTWDKSGRKMDFDEIYQATYNMINSHAYSGLLDPKDPRLTIEGHLKALAFMIEHKLVVANVMYG